jgi:hypothetical protein
VGIIYSPETIRSKTVPSNKEFPLKNFKKPT